MKAIVGYGNVLRGEDAFGIDVIKKLQKLSLQNVKLIQKMMLTPELVLELIDVDEIIFIDVTYCIDNPYTFACSLLQSDSKLSHQLTPKTIITLLNELYKHYPKWQIFSMMTSSFDKIKDKKRYEDCVEKATFAVASLC